MIYLKAGASPDLPSAHRLYSLFRCLYAGLLLPRPLLHLSILAAEQGRLYCRGLGDPGLSDRLSPLLAKAEEVFPPVRTLFLTLGDTFFHSPWGAILLLLVVVLLFSLIGWLLIRRTNIRGGMLSSK